MGSRCPERLRGRLDPGLARDRIRTGLAVADRRLRGGVGAAPFAQCENEQLTLRRPDRPDDVSRDRERIGAIPIQRMVDRLRIRQPEPVGPASRHRHPGGPRRRSWGEACLCRLPIQRWPRSSRPGQVASPSTPRATGAAKSTEDAAWRRAYARDQFFSTCRRGGTVPSRSKQACPWVGGAASCRSRRICSGSRMGRQSAVARVAPAWIPTPATPPGLIASRQRRSEQRRQRAARKTRAAVLVMGPAAMFPFAGLRNSTGAATGVLQNDPPSVTLRLASPGVIETPVRRRAAHTVEVPADATPEHRRLARADTLPKIAWHHATSNGLPSPAT